MGPLTSLHGMKKAGAWPIDGDSDSHRLSRLGDMASLDENLDLGVGLLDSAGIFEPASISKYSQMNFRASRGGVSARPRLARLAAHLRFTGASDTVAQNLVSGENLSSMKFQENFDMNTLPIMKTTSCANDFPAFAPMSGGATLTAMTRRRTRRSQLGRALFIAIAVLMGLAIMAPRSYAGEVIYETKFESPAFVAGQLVGQDDWAAPPPLSPDAALISTDRPRQGRQSVQVFGGNLVHQDSIYQATGGYYDAIGSYRKQVDYDTEGAKVVRVSAHVRVDGRQTDNQNFFSASISVRGATQEGSTGIGELAISSDGQVHGYSGADDVPDFLASAPVTLGEWHTLAVETNFATRTSSFFVDDQHLKTFNFDPSVTNTLARASMVVYAAPDTATALKANYTAQFDRFVIQVIGQK
jgi:hypothetical protein